MQIFLLLVGLTLLVISIKWFIQLSKSRQLYFSELKDGHFTLQLKSNQIYNVSILGGYLFSDDDFKLTLKNSETEELIQLIKEKFKYSFRKNGIRGFVHFSFEVPKDDYYLLQIENAANLKLTEKHLSLLQIRSPKFVEKKQIMIKESITSSKKFFSILFLVFGADIFLIGVLWNLIQNTANR